jgi:predicted RNase H-like HicB family nuclease
MDHLTTGDYLVNGEVLVERKTVRDVVTSLVDGRLFPQVARLAQSPYRSLLLIEGPTPSLMPDVHHHSVDGALVSIAAIWRVPVLYFVRFRTICAYPAAPRQSGARPARTNSAAIRSKAEAARFEAALSAAGAARGRTRPCTPASLPLRIDRTVVTVDAPTLAEVRGIGARKAGRIRELVGAAPTASVRGLRGCHTQGRTVDEARRRIVEAMELFVGNARAAKIVDNIKLPLLSRRLFTRTSRCAGRQNGKIDAPLWQLGERCESSVKDA